MKPYLDENYDKQDELIDININTGSDNFNSLDRSPSGPDFE